MWLWWHSYFVCYSWWGSNLHVHVRISDVTHRSTRFDRRHMHAYQNALLHLFIFAERHWHAMFGNMSNLSHYSFPEWRREQLAVRTSGHEAFRSTSCRYVFSIWYRQADRQILRSFGDWNLIIWCQLGSTIAGFVTGVVLDGGNNWKAPVRRYISDAFSKTRAKNTDDNQ